MNSLNNSEVAAQVITRILEDAAFIFTDELESKDLPAQEDWEALGFSLSFSGEISGTLHMWADIGFARYAAANMLGIDEGDENAQEKGIDAMKEILNMVVGNFITALYGDEPIFDLGIPEKIADDELINDYDSDNAVWLQAEGNPVLLVIKKKDD